MKPNIFSYYNIENKLMKALEDEEAAASQEETQEAVSAPNYELDLNAEDTSASFE